MKSCKSLPDGLLLVLWDASLTYISTILFLQVHGDRGANVLLDWKSKRGSARY